MQHVVFGAGLIGGFLYGVLQRQIGSVAMVARPAIKLKLANGLTVSDYEEHSDHVDRPAFIEADQAAPCAYVWLTVKCHAIVDALEQLGPFIDDETIIFCCQNGLGAENAVKLRFPHNRVLRAMVPFNVAEIEPGHLRRSTPGGLIIECDQDDVRRLTEQLNSPLMPASACADIQPMLWAKLQMNLSSAVNALADIPMKAMIGQLDFRRCTALLMDELLAVVKAKGIQLPEMVGAPADLIPMILAVPNPLFQFLAKKNLAIDPTLRTSMWWDIELGRLTEVDYLNGVVVAEGQQLGIPCPANKRITEMIHELERGERSRGISAQVLLKVLQGA